MFKTYRRWRRRVRCRKKYGDACPHVERHSDVPRPRMSRADAMPPMQPSAPRRPEEQQPTEHVGKHRDA